MIHARQPGRPATHRGFTLLELVVSAVVLSVILVGLGSAMLIAGRALPETRSAATATMAAAEAADSLCAELRYATAINQRSATMIEFVVPDRNSDSLPEIIRYEWSGVSGAALTRRYNAGSEAEVLGDVREFSLSYETETISTQIPQGNESAETILREYRSTVSQGSYPIKDLEWYGAYFLPALPADAVSWKVTRVVISAGTDGASAGESRVQLQLPTTGTYPSGSVLEEKRLLESALPAEAQDCAFTFSNVAGLSPQQGLCLVVKWVSDAVACRVWGQTEDVPANGSLLLKSTNRGASWSSLAGQSLLYTIYGTVTTTGTPQVQSTHYLNGVGLRLRAGADGQSTVQSAVRMLNKPEVSL